MTDIVERLLVVNPSDVEAAARVLDAAEEIRRLREGQRAADAEIERLREALRPMTEGLYWLTHKDVDRAREALGE